MARTLKPGGNAPKPEHLRLLDGGRRNRPPDTTEPKPQPCGADTRPPKGVLDGVGRAFWRKYWPMLYRAGMISAIDVPLFLVMCQRWSDYRHAKAVIAAEGLTFETKTGYIQQHPCVGIANKASADLLSIAQHYGLTPASRARVNVDEIGDEDGFEELLD